MPEVGVALALRSQSKLLTQSSNLQKKKSSKQPLRNRKHVSDNNDRKPTRNESWQLLLEGSALYLVCLILPSVLRLILGWYQQSLEEKGMLRRGVDYTCSYSWIANSVLYKACGSGGAAADTLGDEDMTRSGSFTDAMAPDAGISDVAIVVMFSISMAVFRIGLVHLLVPRYLEQPQRLEALVRCKSVHLLSSSYTGMLTPRESIKRVVSLDDEDGGLPSLPSLGGNDLDRPPLTVRAPSLQQQPVRGAAQRNSLRSSFLDEQKMSDLSPNHSDGEDWMLFDASEHNVEPSNDRREAFAPPPAVSSGLLTSSSAHSLQALLQQATATAPTPDSTVSGASHSVLPQHLDRLFAAPKYATAIFRLIYCIVCVTIALLYFSDADFWPPAVGGRGDTKNCWDLSSVGAVVMDSDFDQHNSVLRRFFLVQASYHFHSGAFHFVTSILLWFVSSTSSKSRSEKLLGFIPQNMLTIINVQQFLRHCFAVGLIAGAYLFSSLRRLAAIGMFAFDVSNTFLHLLQLCINAPPNRRRSNPTWVWILHRGLVIPSFCYSRFYVFPFVVGYSAIVESQNWLRQLENMVIPGSAKYIQLMFGVWLALLMAMNIVYVKRLLYHPHVLQALNRDRVE